MRTVLFLTIIGINVQTILGALYSENQCGPNYCSSSGAFICSVGGKCLQKAVKPTRQQKLGNRYVGRWQLTHQYNYVEYLKSAGVNPISVMLAEQLRPQVVITNDGGNYKFITEVVGTRTLTYDFFLDGDYMEETVDGRMMGYRFVMSRGGKLVQYQIKLDPKDKDSIFERYIVGNQLICDCQSEDGVIGRRIFTKIG